MTTITIPRETWDATREALEELYNNSLGFNSKGNYDMVMAREALSAAKAVSDMGNPISEPFVVGGPHVREKMLKDQIRDHGHNPLSEVQPQAQGGAVDYDYQATFNAISEAAKPSANGLAISVKQFWESYRASTHPQASEPQAHYEEQPDGTVIPVDPSEMQSQAQDDAVEEVDPHAEIERLEGEAEAGVFVHGRDMDFLRAERNAALAKLSAMEKQEPVAWMYSRDSGKSWHLSRVDPKEFMPDFGGIVRTLSYTAPKEAQVEQYETAMSPRRWNQEMNDAWNLNIPDLQAAFDALKQAAIGGQQP